MTAPLIPHWGFPTTPLPPAPIIQPPQPASSYAPPPQAPVPAPTSPPIPPASSIDAFPPAAEALKRSMSAGKARTQKIVKPPRRTKSAGVGGSKHSSCEAQLAVILLSVSVTNVKPQQCDKTANCSSCRVRGDTCVWTGAAPAKSGGSSDFPEASTRAQREIARLRALVAAYAAKSGIDPDDPALLEHTTQITSTQTESPASLSGVEGIDSSYPSSSASSCSAASSRHSSPVAMNTDDEEERLPVVQISHVPDDQPRRPSIDTKLPPNAIPYSQQYPHHHSTAAPERPTISTNTSDLLQSPVSPAALESPSITPTSFNISCQAPGTGWYERSEDVTKMWPSAAFDLPQQQQQMYQAQLFAGAAQYPPTQPFSWN
ncbi:fungal specific transcription factor [Pseudohyphozyma bogoriensis]|nr:fungal specific transcription factor [Pseudohyphozyma bogoriensis]